MGSATLIVESGSLGTPERLMEEINCGPLQPRRMHSMSLAKYHLQENTWFEVLGEMGTCATLTNIL